MTLWAPLLADIYRGHKLVVTRREVEVSLDGGGCGAGTTSCIECGGTGTWPLVMPHMPIDGEPCVPCKGTGRIWLAVA